MISRFHPSGDEFVKTRYIYISVTSIVERQSIFQWGLKPSAGFIYKKKVMLLPNGYSYKLIQLN